MHHFHFIMTRFCAHSVVHIHDGLVDEKIPSSVHVVHVSHGQAFCFTQSQVSMELLTQWRCLLMEGGSS